MLYKRTVYRWLKNHLMLILKNLKQYTLWQVHLQQGYYTELTKGRTVITDICGVSNTELKGTSEVYTDT